MKVYFANSFLEGCYYVRCLLPLVAGGWDGDRTSIGGERLEAFKKSKATIDSDVVVFHRPNDDRSLEAARLLKLLGRKIVFDNDDTYKGIDAMKLGSLFKEIDKNLDQFIREADLVTCSTEFLAKEYRKINPNVVVLPNCVDPNDWPSVPQRNEGEKVRIGFVGSVALNNDMDGFRETLARLNERPDVQLVLFSLPPKQKEGNVVNALYKAEMDFWNGLNAEWQPFVSMEKYMDTLDDLKLDIMVIPRKDDYFNRCKSNLKFLEASMLEIPCVSQGFPDQMSPYEVDPEDAVRQIIVSNRWDEALEKLIQDKEARRRMGKEARQYVENKYSIYNNIQKWETAYKKLCES